MGFFINLFILSSIESFGVAYLSPYIPFEEKYKKDYWFHQFGNAKNDLAF